MLRTFLFNFFNLIGGGKGLFIPNGRYEQRVSNELVVLTPGKIPTTELYLHGWLESTYGKEVRYVDVLQSSPQCIHLNNNTKIVLVRYAPAAWLSWLESQKDKLTKVIFLMDDDIPAAILARELPFSYATKTAWRYACTKRLLSRLCSEVWVSTSELQRRYIKSSPTIREPGYIGKSSGGEVAGAVYFYHGSWAHQLEIKWLVPIIERVQDAMPHAWFEIIGNQQVKQLFSGIPRVRIVHPMQWKDYLVYANMVQYQVGLAPCFDTNFNRARSHSKIYDITRLGAAGIYSNVTPYSEKIIAGRTGILCANDQEDWIKAIIQLLEDGQLCNSLYVEAKSWCESRRGML